MKKIVLLVAFAAFLTSCSQYTCPTYSKKEAPKKATTQQKI
jgi:PBP1b-binding outer membrane lipoprotein LpoB